MYDKVTAKKKKKEKKVETMLMIMVMHYDFSLIPIRKKNT